ncbi:unnamed protein product [Nezara viridula]|uniref:Odorant receptor n=1 Tax=Nezara viridula TaxID=85310 RepID=A0A9P0HRE9_NEZVI|nr:unnamed protein product [Nezara viridula]
MSHQPIIKDSDIIDGLSVRYLKLYGLWKVINDYRETGKKNVIIKFHLLATLVLALPSIISQMISYFVIDIDIQKAKTGDPVYIFRFIQLLAYQGIEVSTICFGSSALETAILQFTYSVSTVMSRMTE